MSTSPTIPETSRAIEIAKYGPASELKIATRPTPKLTKPTDVLVRIHAFSVNPVDWKVRMGNLPFSLKFPLVLGADFSGEVVAVGEKVTAWKVGDEVFGAFTTPFGSYADYACVDTTRDAIAAKPKNISHEHAAAVGVCILTAYQGLHFLGGLPIEKTETDKPKKVLVIGASGGIGTYAIQIAKHVMGAYTVGVCSTKNVDIVISLGADSVIDYKKDDFTEVLKAETGTYDVILDLVGGEDYYEKTRFLLKPSGSYVTAVGPIAHLGSERLGLLQTLGTLVTIGTRKVSEFIGLPKPYKFVSKLPSLKLGDVVPWFADGRVKSVVPSDQVFTFENTYKAHELSETLRVVGKIVVNVN